jgi:uncharacterized protein YegP (UPF0339 family)
MTGYYEVYKFRAANHKVIASGESYRRKIDCLAALKLMKGSGDAPVKVLS